MSRHIFLFVRVGNLERATPAVYIQHATSTMGIASSVGSCMFSNASGSAPSSALVQLGFTGSEERGKIRRREGEQREGRRRGRAQGTEGELVQK